MWVILDQLGHLRRRDYTLDDVGSQCFRLIIAVPFGTALTGLAAPAIAAPCAFLIGVFPTSTLITIARRLFDRKLDLGDLADGGPHLDLERLQGVSRPQAERFAEEGYRSLLQLAYTDPFVLTVRTSYDFDCVSDLIAQALFWTYARDEGLSKVQALGLRSAVEVTFLRDALKSDDADEKARAETTVAEAAQVLGMSVASFQGIL
jgi:hypothetical protein